MFIVQLIQIIIIIFNTNVGNLRSVHVDTVQYNNSMDKGYDIKLSHKTLLRLRKFQFTISSSTFSKYRLKPTFSFTIRWIDSKIKTEELETLETRQLFCTIEHARRRTSNQRKERVIAR